MPRTKNVLKEVDVEECWIDVAYGEALNNNKQTTKLTEGNKHPDPFFQSSSVNGQTPLS